MQRKWHVLVTGGAGYVGAVLVPKLLDAGHTVTVLDLYMYGEDVLKSVENHPNLIQIKGDLRHPVVVEKALAGCDGVIHLACISNDPSFELNPALGREVNFDCFRPLVKAAKKAGVKRFIYASSSSVYGIKEGVNVTEELSLEPLTDYSKYKALCEEVLTEEREPGFTTLILRPATVCGYSPRQRLDVIVNILCNHAVNTGKIKVFGGSQLRPNIHIEDMTDLYCDTLQFADEQIDGKIYNAGFENHSVLQLGEMVKRIVGHNTVELEMVPTDDNRSYHVSSEKIAKELGWRPKRTIEDAVVGMVQAFRDGKLPDSMTDARYFNIKTMQDRNLA
jgi:nucleoside-diphosphate-sugar epimerase